MIDQLDHDGAVGRPIATVLGRKPFVGWATRTDGRWFPVLTGDKFTDVVIVMRDRARIYPGEFLVLIEGVTPPDPPRTARPAVMADS